jgi:adenylate cyclase
MKEEVNSTAPAENRRLAAIMFIDIAGFSRQMGADEARMLRLLDIHNHLIQQAVAEHHGTVIKTIGDAFLIDFPSVVHATQCAQTMQTQFRVYNAEKESAEQIHVRIGIHLGDIVQRNGDVFGDGVNIAKRLQELTEPDTICISDVVYRDVVQKISLGTVVSLGRPQLKNIAQRLQVYALLSEPPKGLRQRLGIQRLKLSRRMGTAYRVVGAMGVLGLVSVGAIAVKDFYLRPEQPKEPVSIDSASAPLPLPDKPSIVVLPFVNMSDDPKQEYFSDGITEDITADLSKISSLFVIARNSAFTYKGKAVKVQDVSREMGVRYVLEGSVRKADNQVRITAQLVDATTSRHLWAERYDRALKNIYLRGLEYGERLTKETNLQARQMFERAMELDTHYAAAYARLGQTHLREWSSQWSSDPQSLEQAFALAQRAVALDNSLPLAHLTLGSVYLWKKQYAQALTEGLRARALDPNNPDIAVGLAEILTATGAPGEAIGLIETAMRRNPRYPDWYLFPLGQAYRAMLRYEEGIAAFKRILARNPDALAAHLNLAYTYILSGREEEARAEVAEVLRISPNFSLKGMRQRSPVIDQEGFEWVLDVLRKAGLK